MQADMFQKEGESNDHIDLSKCETLGEVYDKTKGCQRCALGGGRKTYVFGEGNSTADLMLIGEAPGAEEDKQGKPFVGRSGQLLTKIMEAVEFKRDDIYITNMVRCRPPDNRNPEAKEIQQCRPILEKQISMVSPKIILLLGKVAANALLNNNLSMAALREGKHKWMGKIDVFVTYHPAALLRNPKWKRFCWEDVQALRKHYNALGGA